MAIETIGEAYMHGWHIWAPCAYGRREGLKSIRKCICSYDLDMATLVATRGRDFPLAQIGERLRCPRCGSRKVASCSRLRRGQNDEPPLCFDERDLAAIRGLLGRIFGIGFRRRLVVSGWTRRRRVTGNAASGIVSPTPLALLWLPPRTDRPMREFPRSRRAALC